MKAEFGSRCTTPAAFKMTVAVLAVMAAVASSCGTRLSHTTIETDAGLRRDEGQVGIGGIARGDSQSATVGDDAGAGAGSGGIASAAGTSRNVPTASASVSGDPKSVSGGTKSTINLATIGNYSGAEGSAYGPAAVALQAWAKDVNSRGGINGHPVNLIVEDDGSDPARYRALVKDAVENKHVIAFLSNWAGLTDPDPATTQYLNERQVPVVGGDLSTQLFTREPMYFPEGTTADEIQYATLANAVRFTNKKKVALFTCVEAQGCKDASRNWQTNAKPLGLDVVYQRDVSIAAPDYTAECLGASQAGAELVAIAVDPASVNRFAASCDRQGFNPTYLFPSAVAAEGNKLAPHIDAYAAIPAFPWVGNDLPGQQRFHAAMAKYAPGRELNPASTGGWASALIFERAARQLSDRPTSKEILAGLWSINGETFGGMTQPITYVQGKGAPPIKCWFTQHVTPDGWTAPAGPKLQCP